MKYLFTNIIASIVPIKVITKKFNPVLLYHSLGDDLKFNKKNIDHVSLEILNIQLKDIQKYWKFVSIDEYANSKNKKGLASVTIDDGYKHVIDQALDIFKFLNIPVTIFINSSTLDGKIFWRDKVRYLIDNNLVLKYLNFSNVFEEKHLNKFYSISKDQKFNSIQVEKDIDNFLLQEKIMLKESDKFCFDDRKYFIKDNLVSYGNHTASHYMLSSLGKDEQYHEINECKKFINKLNVNKSEVFSIPFGGDDSFNKDTLLNLEYLNYKTVLKSTNDLDAYSTSNEICRFMPKSYAIKKTLKKLFLKKMIRR